jgi:hypothetical protein
MPLKEEKIRENKIQRRWDCLLERDSALNSFGLILKDGSLESLSSWNTFSNITSNYATPDLSLEVSFSLSTRMYGNIMMMKAQNTHPRVSLEFTLLQKDKNSRLRIYLEKKTRLKTRKCCCLRSHSSLFSLYVDPSFCSKESSSSFFLKSRTSYWALTCTCCSLANVPQFSLTLLPSVLLVVVEERKTSTTHSHTFYFISSSYETIVLSPAGKSDSPPIFSPVCSSSSTTTAVLLLSILGCLSFERQATFSEKEFLFLQTFLRHWQSSSSCLNNNSHSRNTVF